MLSNGVIFMQNWSKLDQHVGEPCPMRRYAHAAVCLNYGGDCPQIFIAGGHDNDTYDDQSCGWILDMHSRRWREVSSLLMGKYGGGGGGGTSIDWLEFLYTSGSSTDVLLYTTGASKDIGS